MKNKKRLITVIGLVTLFVAIALVGIIFLASKTFQSDKVTNHIKDNGINIMQREALFNHIGYDMQWYEVVEEKDTGGRLQQWWYKGTMNPDSCIYIAVGNLQKNHGNSYAEFEEFIPTLTGDELYELEITVGTVDENGYIDTEKETRSYYFLQDEKDIAFVNLVVNQ